MKINIPLMPISVDLRVRRLPPFRFSLLHLIFAIAFFGLLFGLMAQLGKRDQALKYHRVKIAEDERNHPNPNGSSPVQQWHLGQMIVIQDSHSLIDFSAFILIWASEVFGVVIVLGRVLDLLLRRFSTDDARPPSPTPNLAPEGPQS